MKIKKISQIQICIFIVISWCMATDFLPLDGQSLNYTQIFFRWPQVVDADSYQITINNDNRPFPEVYNADQNSIIIEVSNWGEQYYWDICGIDIDNEYINSKYRSDAPWGFYY